MIPERNQLISKPKWNPADDKGFRPIYYVGPSQYARDHLVWHYWTDRAGDIRWRVFRNDNISPTEDDMKIVDEATKFIAQEGFVPLQ